MTALKNNNLETKVEEAKSNQTLHRIKAILDDAKGKKPFKAIKDPSEWQREIREEWDRDFSNIK